MSTHNLTYVLCTDNHCVVYNLKIISVCRTEVLRFAVLAASDNVSVTCKNAKFVAEMVVWEVPLPISALSLL